jgi:hypothetical protein
LKSASPAKKAVRKSKKSWELIAPSWLKSAAQVFPAMRRKSSKSVCEPGVEKRMISGWPGGHATRRCEI